MDYEKLISKGKCILGYEQSEALLAFFYDTPNNTLSSFWFENPDIGWNPLFPRKRDLRSPNWGKDIKIQRSSQRKIRYGLGKVLGRG